MYFSEHRSVRALEPLRQGDLLEATDPDAPKWSRHLVVITADCDLAFDKHKGRVTCVPLLTQEEYLHEMQVPKLRDRYAKAALKPLSDELTRAGQIISGGRLREWASERPVEEIVAALSRITPSASKYGDALKAVRHFDHPTTTLGQAVHNLTAGYALNSPKTKDTKSKVVSDLREPYKQPPGDALFIGSISDEARDGYFAFLRHIEQVREPEIALGPTRRKYSHRRIARLDDRFTHALVQRFAMVFLAIGLPAAYEENRDFQAELLMEK